MKHVCLLLLAIMATSMPLSARQNGLDKLSPWLRHQLKTHALAQTSRARGLEVQEKTSVCAFVRIEDEGEAVLASHGAASLASMDDLHVALIPLGKLAALAADKRVSRIEAKPMGHLLTDSMAHHLNATAAYQGQNLPEAFTGRGVVVGVMDIGFDLTHPTFYDPSGTDYRIARLWDMLSTDTVGSAFPVGRDYAGAQSLLNLGHTYDGLDQTHGTHTLGIAGGSGHGSPYRGMAPESELCLVANAVSDNAALIPPERLEEYTFATDALGFKYLFDYAESQGKPCVASFSEGSGEDFWGYDLLYQEMIDRLLGPGRILVAAAGNQGQVKTWFRKEAGQPSRGTFLAGTGVTMCTLKSADAFVLRLAAYDGALGDTLLLPTSAVLSAPDSLWRGRLFSLDSLEVEAYPSCYAPGETCYDVTFYRPSGPAADAPLSIEVLGSEADVEFYRVNLSLVTNAIDPSLTAGERTRNIHSPSSLPRVISVGATTYRDSVLNLNGVWKRGWQGERGRRAPFSSVGPTLDGRVKPDVMAPGNNIISSYSSFYLEQHPDAGDNDWDVERFAFQGRTYAWNSNTGTSMSCPAVAGAIALWLQAKPTLTPEEAMDVIAHTSRRPDPELAYPNTEYGHGEIDVYRGLLYLLGIDGMKTVSATHTRAKIAQKEGQLVVLLPQTTAAPLRLSVYSLSGQRLLSESLPAGQAAYSLRLPGLKTGVYAVQLDGNEAVAGSTLIRID